MKLFRIALGNVRFPRSGEESVSLAQDGIEQAARAGAQLLCFPECFVPGYRGPGTTVQPPDPVFLQRAWSAIADSAARARITVILGTERFQAGKLRATALVLDPAGAHAGVQDRVFEGRAFQDKIQLDPSEDEIYTPGTRRRIFRAGPLVFGIVICHEGFRYPETVRWAAQRGAHIVFHPQFHQAEPGSYRPTTYGDPNNTFHEKSALCRAAENTCYFATVNHAGAGSPTTSAIIRPDGTLLSYQPYGKEGLLVADIDITAATGLLAARYRPMS